MDFQETSWIRMGRATVPKHEVQVACWLVGWLAEKSEIEDGNLNCKLERKSKAKMKVFELGKGGDLLCFQEASWITRCKFRVPKLEV